MKKYTDQPGVGGVSDLASVGFVLFTLGPSCRGVQGKASSGNRWAIH